MLSSPINNQKGDTIVEVLIAVVVASSVMVGAYAISNLSLKYIRIAQERSEAQKIAVQSVEKLEQTNRDASPVINTDFCITYNSSTTKYEAPLVSTPTCNPVSPSIYKTIIHRSDASNPNLFKVRVEWPSLKGGTDHVEMYYKISGTT